MDYRETSSENRLTNILEVGFIALFMLAMFLLWGHLQGRSHQVIDLYLAYCKGLEQGISTVLSICRIDVLSFL